MKKIIGFATSFVLGFAFFVAGSATALEINDPSPQEAVVIESSPEPQVEATVEVSPEEPVEESSEGDVYCFQLGKSNELGGDCFCVQDNVSSMAEVDCLIASGIVPAESYETYRQFVLGE